MRQIHRSALGTLCAVAMAGVVVAQENPSEEPSIVGCGKSRAMITAGEQGALGQPEGGVAEAMGDTDVLHYNLDIELTNLNPGAGTCTITGTNTITVQNKSNNLTQFTIRLGNWFTITSVRVNNIQVSMSNNTPTTWTVTLDHPYAMDEVFTVMIAYTGTPQNVGLGSFMVSSHSGTAVVATLSEPYYAYTWWPVKDGDLGAPGDNSDKATVEMSVTTPNNFTVAGNGVLQSVQTLSGNRKKYHWASTSEMATYLASFGTTNYTKWTKTYTYPGGTMPVEFYIYPENDVPPNGPLNRAGWEKVTDMMAAFRPLFGEYPFVSEKYGLYNFPFGGGMEHQTMTGQSSFSENLTAHELAHQWWGDNVTCKTWSDIWLNEGFATYAEALWLEFKFGASDKVALKDAMIARKPSAFDDSVYIPASLTYNASRIFNSNFSYRKGAWVLHQLRHVVGDATFFQILANYRAQYEGGAPTTDDFAAVASTTYGQDLTWFFDEMVYAVGSPAYRWGSDTIDVDGQKYLHVRIEQTQSPPYLDAYAMPVDVVATNTSGTKQTVTVWNDQRNQRFVAPLSITPLSVMFDPDQWILRTSLATRTLMIGDMDNDNDVDNADYNAFTNCYSGSSNNYDAGCQAADMDGDGDVDCTDWTAWQTTWTAGGSPPSLPFCGATGPVPAASTWGVVTLTLAILCFGSIFIIRSRSEMMTA